MGTRTPVARVKEWPGALEHRTRPVDPETGQVLAARWAELPAPIRTDAQTLGRMAVGCEGTRGMFPSVQLRLRTLLPLTCANRVTEITETQYVRTPDGLWIAYQVVAGRPSGLSDADRAVSP
jgi:hypothetical protein